MIELDKRNYRKHPDKNKKLIKKSLSDYGAGRSILIDRDDTVIAGNGVYEQAKELNIPIKVIETDGKELVVVKRTDIGKDDEKRKDMALLDNQSGETSEFDYELISNDFSIEKLKEFAFDLKCLPQKDVVEDEAPPIPETPRTVKGDIYQLGNHRVMCGDSTIITDVENLMDGVYPDLIHTDPPYGMNAVTKSGVLSKNYTTDIIGDCNPDIAKDAFRLINGLYKDAKQIWWGANYYCSVLPDSECWLVWDKDNGQSDQTDCELAWANFRSVVRQFTQSSEKTNRVHPTQKPVSLMAWIIKRFNLSSKTIADFFGGSGSTLIAAEKHNIASFIMEFDPKFCDVIVQRWVNLTGGKVILNGQEIKWDKKI